MRLLIATLSALTLPGFASEVGIGLMLGADVRTPETVRIVTAEPNVVPIGTPIAVRTRDVVKTSRAFRTTVYEGSMASDIVDQNGSVLIPKASPVELVVRSISYLGPGGAGMTDLVLDLQAITVNGRRYPIETNATEKPGAGGLRLNQHAARALGSEETSTRILTAGSRIDVPRDALLEFETDEPIRLGGSRS